MFWGWWLNEVFGSKAKRVQLLEDEIKELKKAVAEINKSLEKLLSRTNNTASVDSNLSRPRTVQEWIRGLEQQSYNRMMAKQNRVAEPQVADDGKKGS